MQKTISVRKKVWEELKAAGKSPGKVMNDLAEFYIAHELEREKWVEDQAVDRFLAGRGPTNLVIRAGTSQGEELYEDFLAGKDTLAPGVRELMQLLQKYKTGELNEEEGKRFKELMPDYNHLFVRRSA